MSASKDKKRRQLERAEGSDKKALAQQELAKKQKKSKATWTAVTVLVVVLVAAILLLNSNIFYTKTTAVTVGDEEFTVGEFNYFYKSAYYSFCNTYGEYINYILDTSKSLDEQEYAEGETWADYFESEALNSMKNVVMFSNLAEEAGYTLSEDGQMTVQEGLNSIDATAAISNITSDQYLAATYGRGVTREVVEDLLYRQVLSSEYAAEVAASYEYDDATLSAHYAENAANYDKIEFVNALVNAEADEDGNITDEAMAAAKETAQKIADAAEAAEELDAEIFDDLAADEGVIAQKNAMTSTSISASKPALDDFLNDSSRKAGDVAVLEESGAGWNVCMYLGVDDNDYNTVSVRHILIKATADEGGMYTDEALEEAQKTAEDLLKEWEDGEATEESFAALAVEHSEDTGSAALGGLYEGVYKNQMVPNFNDFCFEEGRKAGDTAVVYGNNGSYAGYHVIYFVGEGDNYRDVLADKTLRNEEYSAWQAEQIANYETSTKFSFMFAK